MNKEALFFHAKYLSWRAELRARCCQRMMKSCGRGGAFSFLFDITASSDLGVEAIINQATAI